MSSIVNEIVDTATNNSDSIYTNDDVIASSLSSSNNSNNIQSNSNEGNKSSKKSSQNDRVNLAALSIRIPCVTLIADDYAAYKIVIADGTQKWIVCRRYSSILKFHKDLLRFAPEALSVLRFPKKKWFGNRQPNYLEKRRGQLELYFRMLLNSNLPRSEALKERIFSFFSKSDPEIENNIIFRSMRKEE